ncbi:MAG: sigma 54-interacting transcriptional regulator [Christensenellales bacterium]
MNKLLLVMPTAQMLHEANEVIREEALDAQALMATSANVVEQVGKAQQQGALVAIARGNQANLILKHCTMPVVEIVLSGQAIARLITRAKGLLLMERPHIAFVGFRNMFGDTLAFQEALQVNIINCFVDTSAEIPQAVQRAKDEGADLMIGGEIAMQTAQQIGLRALFLESARDSIQEAVKTAKRVLYAIELEKKNSNEVMALLNYTFDGVLRINAQGEVDLANYMAEKVFRRRKEELIGKPISQLLEATPDDPIRLALREGKNTYATVMRFGNTALVVNTAAVANEGKVDHVILSFQEFKTIDELEEGIRQERYDTGYTARFQFKDLALASPQMMQACDTATKFARYDLPIMLRGELGTGKRAFAQCIHNASLRKKNPFLVMACEGLPGEVQQSLLMGRRLGAGSSTEQRGYLEIAHKGTLYLSGVQALDPFCQHQLLRVLREKGMMIDNSPRVLPLDVRIICSADSSLDACVARGSFSQALYCLLSQVEICLPPLRERPLDTPLILERALANCNQLYHRSIVLSDAARALILAQPWEGNGLQLELFCEKMVILADSKLLDEEVVRRHLPARFSGPAQDTAHVPLPAVVYESPEKDTILRLLAEHGGHRAAVADRMGISKSTLWRKMKRYDIAETFLPGHMT